MVFYNYFQSKRTMWRITQVSIIFIYNTLKIINAMEEYNHEERSQRGIALLNHTYESVYAANYPSCLKTCIEDSQCMSINYWWNTSQCDLNNKSKYSAEPTLLNLDASSIYMGLMREPRYSSPFDK